jgi:hypothetical protein
MAQYKQILEAERARVEEARVTLVDYLERKIGGSLHPAIQIYRDEMESYPRKNQFGDIIENVGANGRLERWREIVNAWKLSGYNPYNVGGMLDCLERDELPDPKNGGSHGESGSFGRTGRKASNVYVATEEEHAEAEAEARQRLAEIRERRTAESRAAAGDS